jgi:hypothetical protein
VARTGGSTTLALCPTAVSLTMRGMRKKFSGGTIHKLPADLHAMLKGDTTAAALWEDITPLARNEWICWVESPKQPETRIRRLEVARSKMHGGMRRPCCWQGCSHQNKNNEKWFSRPPKNDESLVLAPKVLCVVYGVCCAFYAGFGAHDSLNCALGF